MRITNLLHYNFSVRPPYFWTITVMIVKLTKHMFTSIEDGEHFSEVELRLTPRIRREMRITVIFQCILSRLTRMIVDYLFIVKFNRSQY